MASAGDKASQLRQLLESKLQQEDSADFEDPDLDLLVHKGFVTERQLGRATREHLRAGPGEEVKPLLIETLLEAFHPGALQPGVEVWPFRVHLHKLS